MNKNKEVFVCAFDSLRSPPSHFSWLDLIAVSASKPGRAVGSPLAASPRPWGQGHFPSGLRRGPNHSISGVSAVFSR